VIATFAGCCATCGTVPYAIHRLTLKKRQSPCSAASCAGVVQANCKPTEPATAFRAVCKDQLCVAERAAQK
jgi:hypothetical protein